MSYNIHVYKFKNINNTKCATIYNIQYIEENRLLFLVALQTNTFRSVFSKHLVFLIFSHTEQG